MSEPARVEIYTRRRCPRCIFARQLLERNGVDFVEHAIESSPAVRVMMRVRTGDNTLPQILINGRAVGGNDELHALEASGELGRLLGRRVGNG